MVFAHGEPHGLDAERNRGTLSASPGVGAAIGRARRTRAASDASDSGSESSAGSGSNSRRRRRSWDPCLPTCQARIARSREAASGVTLASITRGDARRLDIPSGSTDAVLLLGPLYHLVEQSDRLQALREARRVLAPRGVLFAAVISRFASLIDGLSCGFFRDAEFRKIVAADLASGQHRNPTNNPAYFTTAYFHRPEELAAEVHDAGFADVQILAVEGPAWSGAVVREVLAESAQRKSLMDFLALIEGEHSVLGASAHLIAVARLNPN